jgi:hypothetical protein
MALNPGAESERPLSLTTPGAVVTLQNAMEKSGLDQFLEIMLKPDNIPIVGLMVLILFFTWLSFQEARKNDQLIEEGRADEILKKMQE